MVASVGKMTDKIERLLPAVAASLHRRSRQFFHHGKNTFDDPVLIAEQFRGFLGMMMRATARSLGFVRRLNASRLIHLYWVFHSYFSFHEKIRRLGLTLSRMHAR